MTKTGTPLSPRPFAIETRGPLYLRELLLAIGGQPLYVAALKMIRGDGLTGRLAWDDPSDDDNRHNFIDEARCTRGSSGTGASASQ
jgi:hypothetical protein